MTVSFLDDLFGEEEYIKPKDNIMIVDFSNILHASFHGSIRFDKTLKDDIERYQMWRFFILNSLLTLKTKFNPDEVILALDSHSWRKDHFKYYKANRVIARAKQTDFNYKEFLEVSNQFIEEIKENFPYRMIKTEGAEADDIITVLAHKFKDKNLIIISEDKDFKQLLRSPNIRLYSPRKKEFQTVIDPYAYLLEHIIRGDSSDGIPNFLSPNNVFVDSNKRQKPITKKLLKAIYEKGIEMFVIENNIIDNYERNKKLIELSKDTIPNDLWNETIYQYNNIKVQGDYIKIVQFLRKHKIKSLVEKVNGFLF